MSDMRRSWFGRALLTYPRLVALTGASALASCLVTNKVDYDQLAIPAQITRLPPREDEFQRVPAEPDEPCPMEARESWMGFEVQIKDLNNQELDVRVLVNGDPVRGPTSASVEQQEAGLFFCIKRTDLKDGCNSVELLLASKFGPDPYEAPNGDLATAHWWVIQRAEDDPYASYLDCPHAYQPDGGMP